MYTLRLGCASPLKFLSSYFDFKPDRTHPEDPGEVPSDLGATLALRYRNYNQLFRDFYFRLPVFFENIHESGGSRRPSR